MKKGSPFVDSTCSAESSSYWYEEITVEELERSINQQHSDNSSCFIEVPNADEPDTMNKPRIIRLKDNTNNARDSNEIGGKCTNWVSESKNGYDLVLPSMARQLSALTIADGTIESTSVIGFDPNKQSASPPPPLLPNRSSRRLSGADAFVARFNGRVLPKHSHHVSSFAVKWNNKHQPMIPPKKRNVSEDSKKMRNVETEEKASEDESPAPRRNVKSPNLRFPNLPTGESPLALESRCTFQSSKFLSTSGQETKEEERKKNSVGAVNQQERKKQKGSSVSSKRQSFPVSVLKGGGTSCEPCCSSSRVSLPPLGKGAGRISGGTKKKKKKKKKSKSPEISSVSLLPGRGNKVGIALSGRVAKVKNTVKEADDVRIDPPGCRLKNVHSRKTKPPSSLTPSSTSVNRSTNTDLSYSALGWWSLSENMTAGCKKTRTEMIQSPTS
eukprot:scaffold791_cov115-Cylindrotheca_fusiformis.AAC.16